MSITAPVHTQSPPATMMLSPYNRRVFRKARFSVIVNTQKASGAAFQQRLKGPRQRRALLWEWRFDGYSTSRICSIGGIAGFEGERIKTPGAVM